MFRPDPLLGVVEHDDVALDDINRADAEASGPRVEEVEIDQLLQRLLQRGGVIQAQRLSHARSSEESPSEARIEKARGPKRCDQLGARGAEKRSCGALRRRKERVVADGRGDQLPEPAKSLHPSFPRIAGDQGGVDCADGDAGHPFGLKTFGRQRLINPSLICAEGAAAQQHQDAAANGRFGCRGPGLAEVSAVTVLQHMIQALRSVSLKPLSQLDEMNELASQFLLVPLIASVSTPPVSAIVTKR
jgi:hypothetical protein